MTEIFCGECKYYNGYFYCIHPKTMRTYSKTPICPPRKTESNVYDVNKNNDCVFFERKIIIKKSFWEKLKFW